uniref:VQ domain-containing protein n=1 Tax=Noccaea caerulescens TaxID=107243 RepID=A0A1J3GKG4_NOCCA
MASSEGLTNVDPWLYRQGFNVDSWLLPDTFSHDSDLLARALHTTVTSSTPHTLSPSSVFFDSAAVSQPSSTYTLSSNLSGGSDPEIIRGGAKRKRNCLDTVSGSQGKSTKRRSRASKKSQTTFITADPSNFRQMVQQVTGSKYDTSSVFFAPIVKPEPHRLVNRLPCVPSEKSTAVPTLDTSAFLSNHHQENLVAGNAFSGNGVVGLPSAKSNATVEGGGSAVEFDTYPTFPTLESWKVM